MVNTSQQITGGVIGTAGHVDHGKSTLVRAITGIDPDRLAEEKAREMTIELGFAWKQRADGIRLSFVDVPGHERFIKNMLAGVGAIDLAVLVIAADEGPMPQTREHLAIIDLLGIPHGVVALTKSDLIDRDWLECVEAEVRDLLGGTSLAGAPIVPVSAQTGENLPLLEQTLVDELSRVDSRLDLGRPRLSIDRAFTIEGFGTVVTGTLLDGALHTGDEIAVLPDGPVSRIRGLQQHGRTVTDAAPGNRVAVNLAGVAVEQLHRGQVLAHPGSITPSERLDARISLLRSAPKAIEQDTRLEFFHGAAEHPMWLTLLDRERIEPGEQGWVQLRFRQPVVVARGDRFILRQPSPGITVGGGVIVDSAPERHRRFQTAVITALEARERDDPETLIAQMIANRLVTRLELESGIATSDLDAAIAVLESGGALIRLPATPSDLFTAPGVLRGFENNLLKSLEQFHRENPARKGMPSDDLRRRSGLTSPPGAFDAITRLLETAGQVIDDGATLRRRGFSIEVPEAQRAAATHWLAAIEQSPFSPPSPGDFGIDANTQLALVERGDLIRAAELVFLTPDSLAAVETSVLGLLDERERISLADVRDRFGTSRKYAQALLELLDARRVTRRIGDERVRFATRTPST